jgi:hypothetical protein
MQKGEERSIEDLGFGTREVPERPKGILTTQSLSHKKCWYNALKYATSIFFPILC